MPASRRDILTIGAAAGMGAFATRAGAATFGDPDEPAQGIVNTQGNPRSAVDPGPQNPTPSGQFPKAFTLPATDVGDPPLFWASFNDAPRRIQEVGWARQVTQADFQISDSISGVNMRLNAGGLRELHWHQAAEWGYMSYGNCRVTAIDPRGRAYVADVTEGDLWYFPVGYPHSLQGLGPDGCEFIIAFDNGKQSEFNTLLVTDWVAHTPPDVLAANFGVPADTFSKNLHPRSLDLPKLGTWPARGGPGCGQEPERPTAEPVHLLAFARADRQADQGRHGPDRRQP